MSVTSAFWDKILKPVKIVFWVIVGIAVLGGAIYVCKLIGDWMALS